jgi:hypothetical protein
VNDTGATRNCAPIRNVPREGAEILDANASWEAVIEPVLEMLPEKADTPVGVIAPPLEMPGEPERGATPEICKP